jgi:ADP-ribose pyrophosphatase
MRAWRALARRVVLDEGRFLRVEHHTVALPDGQIIEDWAWLALPGFAIIVAVTESSQFIVFRQVKYAIEGETLAPAGGYLEPGEDPLQGARRELREETGYEAAKWVSLGRYAVDGNRGAGVAHLYLALGARRVTERDADDLEEQELLLLARHEIEAALDRGEFKVLPWAAAVALALRHLT